MRGSLAVTLLLLTMTAACAPSTKIILLPNEGGGGTSGSVALLSEEGDTVATIDDAYSVARVHDGGRRDIGQTTEEALAPRHVSLIQDLPQPPRSFVLYFEEGTTTLVPASEPALVDLFKEVEARSGADVQVVGHTDTLGSGPDNDSLSRDRAKEIAGVLIESGLPSHMVSAVGRGERELLVETEDGTSNPLNRRVEVLVR